MAGGLLLNPLPFFKVRKRRKKEAKMQSYPQVKAARRNFFWYQELLRT